MHVVIASRFPLLAALLCHLANLWQGLMPSFACKSAVGHQARLKRTRYSLAGVAQYPLLIPAYKSSSIGLVSRQPEVVMHKPVVLRKRPAREQTQANSEMAIGVHCC